MYLKYSDLSEDCLYVEMVKRKDWSSRSCSCVYTTSLNSYEHNFTMPLDPAVHDVLCSDSHTLLRSKSLSTKSGSNALPPILTHWRNAKA